MRSKRSANSLTNQQGMSVPDLFKLVTRGLQDTRLQPETKGKISADQYVSVYKSSTRWAAQFVRVDFDTGPNFGVQASVTLPRRGDFLHRMFLVVTLPDIYTIQNTAAVAAGDASLATGNKFLGPTYSWTNSIGHALIDTVTLEIGGVQIATLDGRLLEILDEFYEAPEKIPIKSTMIGRVETWTPLSLVPQTPLQLHIPLPFWFTQHLAQSLPMEALSVDSVRCQVTFRTLEGVIYTTARTSTGAMPAFQGGQFYRANPASKTRIYSMNERMSAFGVFGEVIPNVKVPERINLTEAYLLAEYISVDDFEAVNLRSASLEYKVPLYNSLGPQQTKGQPTVRVAIPYNNPTQDIIWMFHNDAADQYNQYFLATRDLSGSSPVFAPWSLDGTGFKYAYSEPITEVALFYNGTQRFSHRQPSLFRSLLPLLHYRKAPRFWRYYYIYPFSHGPGYWDDTELGNPYQPKGLANFDKLSRKEIAFTMTLNAQGGYTPMTVYVWTTTWNILRVFGGRAAMLFAI